MFNLGLKDINILFPFNILLDRNLQIISQGSSNLKLFGNLNGQYFYNQFLFVRPKLTISMNFDSIIRNLEIVIIVKNINNELLFRGQFILVDDKLLFVNSPWVFSSEILLENNLLINDFAIHDTVIDSIDVIQSKEILNNDLLELNNDLSQKKELLEKTIKELNHLTYIISHDLKEPLRTISNFIEIINQDYGNKLDQSCVNYLNIIDSSSKRMKILIDDVLDSYRLGIVRQKQIVDFDKIIQDVFLDLKFLINSSKANISITNKFPRIACFESEIRQLFQNLISNAIKYSKKNTIPEIKINSEKINDYWQFSVSDKGIGIDSNYFEKIFNIFEQVENENKQGYGVGLASCRKIIDNHSGKIWVTSELGKGSTFYFTIKI
jgi:signal transduction histidine kinase